MRGSRWARLIDGRAGRLLAAEAVEPALVLAPPGGFPCLLPVSGTTDAAPATIVDTTRPEEPGDHRAMVEQLAQLAGDTATVVLVACGGSPAAGVGPAPRSLTVVEAALAGAGFDLVKRVPFDVLGPLSPWRLGLGARRDAVFAELEEHLTSPAVRRAARLVERHVVAVLPPQSVGRVLVVARRAPVPAPVAVDPNAALAAPAFADAFLPLLHDDAVVRWLAFVDAEWLSADAVGFDLIGFLRDLTAPADRRAEVAVLLRRQRRWWQPRLEEARLAEAASHRLAQATIAAVDAALGDGIAGTLLYPLVGAFNAEIDRVLAEEDRP
jgi:hypothetical protein